MVRVVVGVEIAVRSRTECPKGAHPHFPRPEPELFCDRFEDAAPYARWGGAPQVLLWCGLRLRFCLLLLFFLLACCLLLFFPLWLPFLRFHALVLRLVCLVSRWRFLVRGWRSGLKVTAWVSRGCIRVVGLGRVAVAEALGC